MPESIEDYVARKKAKGTFGKPKPYKFEGKTVLAAICPCGQCGHEGEPMLICDPDYENCKCCNEVCS